MIMQTKEKTILGRDNNGKKFHNYILSGFIVYWNLYKKILKHLQSQG